MKTFPTLTLFVLVLFSSIAAFAEPVESPCETTCTLCLGEAGPPVLDCRDEPEPEAERLPPAELEQPETDRLEPVHQLVAKAVLEHWPTVLEPVFGNSTRIYLPRHLWRLAEEYPEALAHEAQQAAAVAFQRDLVRILRFAFLEDVPDGFGGSSWIVRSRDFLGSFVLRLLREAGVFPQEQLAALADEIGNGLAPMETRAEPPRLQGPAYQDYRRFTETLTSELRRLADQAIFEALRTPGSP